MLNKPRRNVVNDRMHSGYVYELTEPAGRSFHPEFTPELTPKEMLALGVFGDEYMADCRDEFPESWFTHARLSPGLRNPQLSFFRVAASKPLSNREEKGWICPDDLRGWFQSYCRYYTGRRCPDDLRQIKRWKAMRGHIAQLKKLHQG